jgi:hypothetical protein
MRLVSVTPREKMSAGKPKGLGGGRTSSGAAYVGVPRPSGSVGGVDALGNKAMPKSQSLTLSDPPSCPGLVSFDYDKGMVNTDNQPKRSEA